MSYWRQPMPGNLRAASRITLAYFNSSGVRSGCLAPYTDIKIKKASVHCSTDIIDLERVVLNDSVPSELTEKLLVPFRSGVPSNTKVAKSMNSPLHILALIDWAKCEPSGIVIDGMPIVLIGMAGSTMALSSLTIQLLPSPIPA